MNAWNLATLALLAALAAPARAEDGAAKAPAAAAPAAAPAAPAAAPAAEEADDYAWDEQKPPPGSPEDVALWRAGLEVSRGINVARLEANKLQWQHRQRKYDERLAALAREEGKPEARRASDLLPRYAQALAHNYVTLTRRWPVDTTRGCRYPAMHFESVLRSQEDRKKAIQLAVTRDELQECLEKARPAIQVMVDSNRDLTALTAEADALLPPIPVARPAAPAPAARN